jgi:hypothetical protein
MGALPEARVEGRQLSPRGESGRRVSCVNSEAGRRVRVSGDLYHPVVPAGAIYVGRQGFGLRRSPWANPFSVREHGRAEALRRYRQWLHERPELIERARRELADRPLACWCALDVDCHADVLLSLIG